MRNGIGHAPRAIALFFASQGSVVSARAQDVPSPDRAEHGAPAPDHAEHRAHDDVEAPSPGPEPAQLPYTVPRQTLIPGTPGMPGGYHLMVNAFAHAQNLGLGGYRITNPGVHDWNGGRTYPLLTDD